LDQVFGMDRRHGTGHRGRPGRGQFAGNPHHQSLLFDPIAGYNLGYIIRGASHRARPRGGPRHATGPETTSRDAV
jgi:hypothetical protein